MTQNNFILSHPNDLEKASGQHDQFLWKVNEAFILDSSNSRIGWINKLKSYLNKKPKIRRFLYLSLYLNFSYLS